MRDNVGRFCESVHTRLEALDGQMDALKLNIGTTWHSLQEKLKEVRQDHEASRQLVVDARTSLESWFGEQQIESQGAIDALVKNHDVKQLAARAQKAEECAWSAIQLAQASIDDAEWMILEAIAAKLDAEAVTEELPQ